MSPKDFAPATVQNRLVIMRELVDFLQSLGEPSAQDLLRDHTQRLAVERALTQLVDLAVDINQHIATTMLESLTTEYRPTFDDAARAGAITVSLADSLKPSVGMRNVLIHEYVKTDLGEIAKAIPLAAEQYRAYVRSVASWLSRADLG